MSHAADPNLGQEPEEKALTLLLWCTLGLLVIVGVIGIVHYMLVH